MYEGLTLAKAVDLMITESIFLFKSLTKSKTTFKHFYRLIRSWIQYIFVIHLVPMDAQPELDRNIVIRIEQLNGIPESQKSTNF